MLTNRIIATIRKSRHLRPTYRVAVATGLVLTGGALRFLLIDHPTVFPFTFFNPAILLSAVFFGRWTGFYATGLSTLITSFSFMEPAFTWSFQSDHQIALYVFILLNILVSYMIGSMHTIVERLETAVRIVNESDSQKALLLRETAHRNRNDLQRLAATIGWQAALSPSPEVRSALETAEHRVSAMASVAGRLDITTVDGGRSYVCSATFLRELLDDIRQTIGDRPIRLESDVEAYKLPLDTVVPIGLIVNEMITNALKYAFPDNRPGSIKIGFHRDGDEFVLRVGDDGVGMPQGAQPKGSGLGMKIARNFAANIGGKLVVGSRIGEVGTLCVVRFPVRVISVC